MGMFVASQQYAMPDAEFGLPAPLALHCTPVQRKAQNARAHFRLEARQRQISTIKKPRGK